MNETKFNGMGKIYSAYRPSYPRELIDYIFADDYADKITAADIGSGTGILTRLLLDRGATVYAVEPNADMRKIAENDLRGHKNFISTDAAAEATTLGDKSVDIITAAQAFHWFDRNKFKAECGRILKPIGKIFLIWNVRDEKNGAVRENDVLNKKYCPNYIGPSGGIDTKDESETVEFFGGGCEMKRFRNDLAYDEQNFIGRSLSSSYALKENDASYTAYVAELKNIFDKYNMNGRVVIPNETRCFASSLN